MTIVLIYFVNLYKTDFTCLLFLWKTSAKKQIYGVDSHFINRLSNFKALDM